MEDIKKFLIPFLLIFTFTTTLYARSFNVVNNCNFPVWYGVSSGGNKIAPADNNYRLAPNGGRSQITLPGTVWSGVLAGRTECTATSCKTADCGGGTGACRYGFSQPATQAEFTVVPTGTDFYDVEVINGHNLPVSITPSVPSKAENPYFCGSPGARTPSPGLGACSWNFQPPLTEYNWVDNGGSACTSSATCPSGTICGVSVNPGQSPLLRRTCGKSLGYWSANQICGVQRDFGAPFNCNQAPPGQGNLTWWHLMACVNVGSCYQPGAGPTCCGCVNWDKIGIPVPPGPLTEQCRSTNPNWTAVVQPTLAWLKRACPTLYTYPYDDMSSTFTCRNMVNGVNTVDYTITFCPGGSTPTPNPDPNPNPNPTPTQCLAPTNIQTSYTADKKSITIKWQQATGSAPAVSYRVSNWVNTPIWTGAATTYVDNTLPGTNGTFTYFLNSNCASGASQAVKVDVNISGTPPTPTPTVCLPPANMRYVASADKKTITLSWQQPANSAPIINYQVNNWLNNPLNTVTQPQYADTTLPGTSGTFVYYVYSRCLIGLSTGVKVNAIIN